MPRVRPEVPEAVKGKLDLQMIEKTAERDN